MRGRFGSKTTPMEFLGASSASRSLIRPVASLFKKSWVCASCRRHGPRRGYATSSTDKPYYVTTPIFYVNASPHLGHMYSMVLADCLKRWQTLRGKRALLCTGTDEHGMKVQRAAEMDRDPQKRNPKAFADIHSMTFQQLAKTSQLDNDFFVRTTDKDHVEAVQYFWQLLAQKGYIYESLHEGWYSVSDECFYPDSAVERKMDPTTGAVYPASQETGSSVEWTVEKNYHFRMTALRDKLLDFYSANPEWIEPTTSMNEVVSWVTHRLEDLSISRPRDRLGWGIQVPGDATQTVYVWVDALVNYLTKAGFPNWKPGRELEGGWPADVHVIGKDILRFHCVYWPALLLAVDLPLPKRVLSHAHWTIGQKKMSKSTGNVVNPFFAMERFGVDALRFYLLYDGGIAYDADYENRHVVGRYKDLLQGGLGNMASRIMRPKKWNVRQTVVDAQARRWGPTDEFETLQWPHWDQRSLLQHLSSRVVKKMDELQPASALREIMYAVKQTNKYLSQTEPWASPPDAESQRLLAKIIFMASETLRIVGILLQPFMPTKAKELLDMLGVDKDRRDLSHAQLGVDFTYGTPWVDPGHGPHTSLFPPLRVEY